jgi:hypothetical protein
MEEMKRAESERANFTVPEKYSQYTTIAVEQSPSGKMAIDVYGQQIEPICNYCKCSHKFSEHGYRCKCRHALNYATGVSNFAIN